MRIRTAPSPDSMAEALPLAEYRAAVGDAVVSLDVQAAAPSTFRGALCGQSSGDIHILGIAADAHSVHRTESLIRTKAQHYFKFTLVERGAGLIVQSGRETALGAGDMTFYDTDRPYSLICADDTRVSVVMFPKDLLALPADVTARLTATKLGADSPVGAIVRPFVASLSDQVQGLDSRTLRRMARGATDMISALIEDGIDMSRAPSAHDALVRRVLDFIDENLASPELSPPVIAAAHFISVRHLHALFSDQGTTVSTVIRNRRLERCYDQLIDPRSAERSVTAVALDNGFVDAAHFSRTFRAHYGVPPSAIRPRRG